MLLRNISTTLPGYTRAIPKKWTANFIFRKKLRQYQRRKKLFSFYSISLQAALKEGYKKLYPSFFIFSQLTVALFNTSMLISPSTISKIKEGTKIGTKNFPLIHRAN